MGGGDGRAGTGARVVRAQRSVGEKGREDRQEGQATYERHIAVEVVAEAGSISGGRGLEHYTTNRRGQLTVPSADAVS